MKAPLILTTSFVDYTNYFDGDVDVYSQIHIFSAPGITSYYFNPKDYTSTEVEVYANNLLNKIKSRNSHLKEITLFSKNNKYLIAEDCNLLYNGPLLEYNPDNYIYEDVEGCNDFFELLEGKTVDSFIKNALITVGAEDLFDLLQSQIIKLIEKQNKNNEDFDKWRELNKTNPLLKLEIYSIDKNYNSKKIAEFLCHNYESCMFLPEHKKYIDFTARSTYLLRDISTNKVIEGSLREFEEGLRNEDELKRNPPFLDFVDFNENDID